jgi:uncharacterized membrane protein
MSEQHTPGQVVDSTTQTVDRKTTTKVDPETGAKSTVTEISDIVTRNLDNKMKFLDKLADLATRQGFPMIFGLVILIWVILPLAEKHSQFVDKVGDATVKIGDSMAVISDATRATSTVTSQNAEVIKQMQAENHLSATTSQEHITITKRIDENVQEIIEAVVVPKSKPTGTRPRPTPSVIR